MFCSKIVEDKNGRKILRPMKMKNKNGTLKLRIYPSLFVLIEITMNEMEYVHSWMYFFKYFSQQKSTNIRLLLLPKQWGGGGVAKCDHSNENSR